MQHGYARKGLAALMATAVSTPAWADVAPEPQQALGPYTVWIVAGVVAVVALAIVAFRRKR